MGQFSPLTALMVLLAMIHGAFGVSLSLCSSENTASSSADYSEYQSNGNCYDTCDGSYAYAITQGSNCWCSDYTPASTVSVSDCDTTCPGYPYEYCGGSGLYGYIKLNMSPSGTLGGSTSTDAQTSSQASATERTVLQTVTEVSTQGESVTTSTSTSTPTTTSNTKTYATSSTGTTTSSTSVDPQTQTVAYPSVVTEPGETKTIIITPTLSSSATTTSGSGSLGQGASNNASQGLSKGAIAGMAIGIALGVMAIAAIILLFLWRRMKQRQAASDADAMTSEMGAGNGSPPTSVSRHPSQMSQHGLLAGKGPSLNTRNLSNGWPANGQSAGVTSSPTGTGQSNRRSIGADQRLDAFHPIYTHEDGRHSDVSLQDNTDYSRKILAVRNPDQDDD